MYNVTFTFSPDVYIAVKSTASNSKRKLREKLFYVTESAPAKNLLRDLSTEPEGPDYPINWTNPQQRKAVMRKLRLAGTIPYPRSHNLSRGWAIVLNRLTDSSGIIGIINDTPYTDYVQGESQQRYLAKWPLARQAIRNREEEMEEEVVNAWIEATSIEL